MVTCQNLTNTVCQNVTIKLVLGMLSAVELEFFVVNCRDQSKTMGELEQYNICFYVLLQGV